MNPCLPLRMILTTLTAVVVISAAEQNDQQQQQQQINRYNRKRTMVAASSSDHSGDSSEKRSEKEQNQIEQITKQLLRDIGIKDQDSSSPPPKFSKVGLFVCLFKRVFIYFARCKCDLSISLNLFVCVCNMFFLYPAHHFMHER